MRSPADGPEEIPVDSGLGDPVADADGSGQCWVTGNGFGNDVDFGQVLLMSPNFDLTDHPDARFNFSFWYDNDFTAFGCCEDDFVIELSDNGGASWTTVEVWDQSNDLWNDREVRVASYVNPTAQVRIRFIAEDAGSFDSTIEAGVDAFQIEVPATDGLFGPAAAGNLRESAGGPFNVLTVNGSSGGLTRTVHLALGQLVQVNLASTPNQAPGFYVIFGTTTDPVPSDAALLPLPSIGTMAFAPWLPTSFKYADPANLAMNLPGPSLVLGAPFITPFTRLHQGLNFAFTATLQAVVSDETKPLGLGVSNAVKIDYAP